MAQTTAKKTPKSKAPRVLKVARREDATRFCRRCALLVVETAFPEGNDWICSACVANGVPAAMPRREHAGHERYDTSKVFDGYRVVKVRQGSGREQFEVEVPAKSGEFYPFAEAAVGLFTKTAHTANVLARDFPEVRVLNRGDDGRCVLVFPVTLFPKLARKCGAFKSRVGLPRSDKQQAATQAATAKLAEVRTMTAPGKQMALEL